MVEPLKVIQLSEDTFEVQCFRCGEPMIMQIGDEMHANVDEEGTVNPICGRCYRLGDPRKDISNG